MLHFWEDVELFSKPKYSGRLTLRYVHIPRLARTYLYLPKHGIATHPKKCSGMVVELFDGECLVLLSQ